MPDFEVTGPDGKKYQVTGPDGSTPEQALAQVQAQVGGEKPGVAEDIIKNAIPGGVGRAVTTTLGLPGDLAGLLNRGIDYGMGKLGLPVTPGNYELGGSGQIQRGIEGLTGKFPEAQTLPGKFVEKGLEIAPAIAGGPETLATRILTRAAAPAAAMTAAEQVTDSPLAQIGAAVGASVLAHKAVTPKAATGPVAEDLATAAKQNYQDVHALGVELKPQSVDRLVTGIQGDLANDGFTARNAKPVYDALDSLKAPTKAVTTQEFDNLRKELVQARQSIDGTVRNAASRSINAMDDYLAKINPADVLKGNAKQAAALFGEARGNYAALKRTEMVQGKLDLAELNAATANSGGNIDNATRQAIKQLIKPDKYGKIPAVKAGYSQSEIAQMQKIARGTSFGNLTRTAGNLLGGGGGLGALAAGAYGTHEAGAPGIALPLIGRGLRGLGNRMTTNAGQRLAAQVAMRSPEGRAYAAMQARNPISPGLSALQTGLLAGLFARPH